MLFNIVLLYNKDAKSCLLPISKTFNELKFEYGDIINDYCYYFKHSRRVFPKNLCSVFLNYIDLYSQDEKNHKKDFKELCKSMWNIATNKNWKQIPLLESLYNENEDDSSIDSDSDDDDLFYSTSSEIKFDKDVIQFILDDERIVETIISEEGPCRCGHKHKINDTIYDLVFIVNDKLVGINISSSILSQLKSLCNQLSLDFGYALYLFDGFRVALMKLFKKPLMNIYHHGIEKPMNMIIDGIRVYDMDYIVLSTEKNISTEKNSICISFLTSYISFRKDYNFLFNLQ